MFILIKRFKAFKNLDFVIILIGFISLLIYLTFIILRLL
jgi:hypothetical protein